MQDLDYDAAIPIYVDRKYFVEYLHEIVFGADHSNILEDFLYVTHSSLQFVAATRACLEGACKFTETAARLEYKGAKTDEDEDASFCCVFSAFAASSVFFEDVVEAFVCSSSWNRASSRDAPSGF